MKLYQRSIVILFDFVSKTDSPPPHELPRMTLFMKQGVANYLAFTKLVSIRIWLRAYKSSP
jgi:hypothetical protein